MNLKQQDFERIFKEHLKVETYSKSIDSLLSPRSLNKINYHPYYQRNYVWDYKKASYFIESILMGTEIPPLIFFNNRSEIEIIDGRQRFETILRYKNNKFPLHQKGLTTLNFLKRLTYDELAKKDRTIIELFLDAKIRIIEFTIVNEPPLDKFLEDRIKKEIFSRYNTGITPLKKSEIDNANYNDDPITLLFRSKLKNNPELQSLLYRTFFKVKEQYISNPPLVDLLAFIRKFLVLHKFPISYYARGTNRTEIMAKLYEYLSDTTDEEEILFKNFIHKVKFVADVKRISDNKKLKYNRLVFECLIWILSILETENIDIDYNTDSLKEELALYFSENIQKYGDKDYHFYSEILERYSTTTKFFEDRFRIDLNIYIYANTNQKFKTDIENLKQVEDSSEILSKLETLRLNKPEPSRNSIEDIRRTMERRRFLVRPSYQRQEVINPTKASSIIESILLGISLPALFIYKREDGINEVIDGQQRILTILGYIGSEYIDENNCSSYSKNHKFSLKKPRILKEIEGNKFEDLDEIQQNRILDFPLYIVEIEENKNPGFDPIDLFIRLNDKPYPIREHSFEMWNSWVDFEVIKKIKELTQKVNSWFYLKSIRGENDRDRMENEELLTSLIFLENTLLVTESRKNLDIYQINDRINARIRDKLYISQFLQEVTESDKSKENFFTCFKSIESFIKKVKIILLDQDICDKEQLINYLRTELDKLFKGGKEIIYFRRTMQDFYILWYVINDINFDMIKYHRIDIKESVKKLFIYIKDIPFDETANNAAYNTFIQKVAEIKNRYKQDDRKIKLSEEEKFDLIKMQNNKSGISAAPIFKGDEIEIDHIIPISKGGKDSLDNMQAVHKDENRSKSSNY